MRRSETGAAAPQAPPRPPGASDGPAHEARALRARARAGGFTLPEALVSLVVSLLVLGVVAGLSAQGRRQSDDLEVLDEGLASVNVARTALARDMAMASSVGPGPVATTSLDLRVPVAFRDDGGIDVRTVEYRLEPIASGPAGSPPRVALARAGKRLAGPFVDGRFETVGSSLLDPPASSGVPGAAPRPDGAPEGVVVRLVLVAPGTSRGAPTTVGICSPVAPGTLLPGLKNWVVEVP
jgi:hypothetical protein